MRPKHIFLFLFLILLQWQLYGQTPGMIIKPAAGGGAVVLDPDGDGYVSQKTNGVQLGFTIPPNNDVTQSEIPYVAVIKPDPLSDLLRGPTGHFSEIVGVDAAGNNAILTYNDGTNFLIRFRLGGYAPNSKSYSLLIDTDGKFGFTGPNADPNAVPGNPGFEVEIVLETNFNVNAYNVNGTTSGTLVASASYDTNCQKSVAVSTAGGDPDYFYDFYLPLSSLSTLFTASTPLRIVAVTAMNPHPAMGNNALSDVGGVTTSGSLDSQFINLINAQTPTVPGQEVLDRTSCPTIDPVTVAATTITGSTTEAAGTSITVKVYTSDGVTLLGSGTITTTGATWSINKSSLSPSVTFAAGQLVKATAAAAGKGASIDNCSTQTVKNCTGNTSTSGVTITKISGGKGYTVTNTFASGTVFTWYNSDYSLAVYPDKNGSLTNITNPVTSASASQTISFSTQQGQTFPAGQYYFTFQQPGQCVSSYLSDCQYSTAGGSTAPVITTSPITVATTTVSGSCGSSAGTVVSLYVNGVFLKSGTVANSTSWSISGLNLTNYSCQTLTASATETNKCPTSTISGVVVSHAASKPAISTSGCSLANVTAVSGTSIEADGTTISLYTPTSSGSLLGTATVASGLWTVSGLNLSSGNIVAKVTAGTCLTPGPDSDPVTISTQTNVSSYTIGINTPTEGQSSVSGTIAGGDYNVTLKLYIDGSQIGSGITVTGAGSWSVGSLLSNDLYIGGLVQVTLTTATGCESALSSTSATVQCQVPSTPAYTGGSFAYCLGGAGQISLTTSQSGVIYQLVNQSGAAVGPSVVGTGSAITLTTNALAGDLTNIYVKAYKTGYSSCSSTASTVINFTPQNPTPSVTFTNTDLSVQQGTTTVNLPYSAKSDGSGNTLSADNYTIGYSSAVQRQGFSNVSTTSIPTAPGNIALAVPSNPATGTYAGTLTVSSNSGGCTRSYGFTITVYGANSPPVISAQPVAATICSGSTTSLSVSAAGSGTLSYQWQTATTFGGTYTNVGANSAAYTTAALSATAYYKVIVSNASGSTTSNIVAVTVISSPAAAGMVTGSATVCAGQSVTYSIAAVSGATSYTWSYSGTGVTITGSSTSVSLAFSSSATSGTLSVSGVNSCGSGTAGGLAITVGATPAINNMTADACSGSSFTVTPTNGANGTVPDGTTYSWSAPVVTGGVTGGASGSGASSITGTLVNPTASIQTATYTVTPVKGSCAGSNFTVTVSVNPPISLTATPTAVVCYGASTGSVSLAVSGGTPVYTYAWTGPNSFTATTQNISSLAAGTYNVTVTDSKGCTATTSASVTQPGSGMGITPSITDVSCYGGNNGAISIAISGGADPKTYLWSDGSAVQNRTGLVAGTYSVTVTDNNGCRQTSSGNAVNQPAAALSITPTVTNVACNGGSTGAISLSVTGGTASYSYAWTGPASFTAATNPISGRVAGTYQVTVTDSKSCTATASIAITEPSQISVNGTVTNAGCYGVSTGSIDVAAGGGIAPYNYKIGSGSYSSAHLFSGLAAGTYTITVKDANLCEKSADFTVGQPTAVLAATPTITNVSCNGGSNGQVTLAVSGGTAPYTYSWSGPSSFSATTKDISGRIAGTYNVTITDVNSCTLSLTGGTAVVITQPAAALTLGTSPTNVSCNGGSNGAISLTVTGGTPSYAYAWSNGATTQNISSLTTGTYSVTVTDVKGCTATTSQAVSEPLLLSGSTSVTAATCNGGGTGGVTLTVSGGTAGYTYLWSNAATSKDLSGVAAGNYSVTITDSRNCTATASGTVTQPAALSLSAAVVQPTCPPTATLNNSDGSITLTVSGGTAGYTYLWTASGTGIIPSGQETLYNPAGLAAGIYSVTVTDSKSCTAGISVTLTNVNQKPIIRGNITK